MTTNFNFCLNTSAHLCRFIFTASLMFVQYFIPTAVILVTHMKIISIVKLRMSRVSHMRMTNNAGLAPSPRPHLKHTNSNANGKNNVNGQANVSNAPRMSIAQTQTPTMRRNKKTTQILLIIALCFGISWLPYHCFMISKSHLFVCIRTRGVDFDKRTVTTHSYS